MPESYLEALARAIPDAQIITSESPQLALIPAQWRAIAESNDPQERKSLALSLWPQDFLDHLPRFAQILHEKLLDVLAVRWQESALCLLYVFSHATRGPQFWLGEDPATFGDHEPPNFDCIPAEVRAFLHQVHAGYLLERDWYGLYQPNLMQTLAHEVSQPDDDPLEIDGWGDDDMLDAHKLLMIAESAGNVRYLVSPELPTGTILTLDDSAQEPPEDFWTVLDDIFSYRLENE